MFNEKTIFFTLITNKVFMRVSRNMVTDMIIFVNHLILPNCMFYVLPNACANLKIFVLGPP